MKRNIWYGSSLLLAGTLSLAVGPEVTTPEREKAVHYLDRTREGLVDATKGFSDEQWKFKPAPNRWSAAEVVEHLVLIENMVHGIVGKMEQAPAAGPDHDPKKVEALILAKVPDRAEKAEAPAPAVPSGRWIPAETLEHFLKSRGETVSLLRSAPGLRGHVVNHPVFGPFDGYEWILAVAAHSERHTKQILELKADPHFPAH
jgi:hypothetical protein